MVGVKPFSNAAQRPVRRRARAAWLSNLSPSLVGATGLAGSSPRGKSGPDVLNRRCLANLRGWGSVGANGLLLTCPVTKIKTSFRHRILVMTRGNQRDLAREKAQKKQQVMARYLSDF